MGTNEVVPADIRKAATKLRQAATGVRGHVPVEVKQVSDALPSSASAGPAARVSAAWDKRFHNWAKRADAQAHGMDNSAAAWEKTDENNAAKANKQISGLGGH